MKYSTWWSIKTGSKPFCGVFCPCVQYTCTALQFSSDPYSRRFVLTFPCFFCAFHLTCVHIHCDVHNPACVLRVSLFVLSFVFPFSSHAQDSCLPLRTSSARSLGRFEVSLGSSVEKNSGNKPQTHTHTHTILSPSPWTGLGYGRGGRTEKEGRCWLKA